MEIRPCGNGSLFDAFVGSATPWIPGGATSATFSFNNSASSDCFHVIVSALSVSSTDSPTYTCAASYDDPVYVGENGKVYIRGNYEIYDYAGRKVYTL